MKKAIDKNGKEVEHGDVINIHQTVNGQNIFQVFINDNEYNAKYLDGRDYEYDVEELLDITEMFSDESTIEVIDNIFEIKEHDTVIMKEDYSGALIGERGVVVHVYTEEKGFFEVEFDNQRVITVKLKRIAKLVTL